MEVFKIYTNMQSYEYDAKTAENKYKNCWNGSSDPGWKIHLIYMKSSDLS